MTKLRTLALLSTGLLAGTIGFAHAAPGGAVGAGVGVGVGAGAGGVGVGANVGADTHIRTPDVRTPATAGGQSESHMSEQGQLNTNGPNATARNFGTDRATDRIDLEANAKAKADAKAGKRTAPEQN